nr:wee1-like protein kinase [Ipomoea batatas]
MNQHKRSGKVRLPMAKKSFKRSNLKTDKTLKSSLTRHFTLGHQSSATISSSSSKPSGFQSLLDCEAHPPAQSHLPSTSSVDAADAGVDEKDFILSQDFFCTPDYITPDAPAIPNPFNNETDNLICPQSPEKIRTVGSKMRSLDGLSVSFTSNFSSQQPLPEAVDDTSGVDETMLESTIKLQKNHSYVSQSAVALRCRVMPPPCIKNPYLKDASETDIDPFGNRRSKCAAFWPAVWDNDGLSRYRTDFHEIEQIGSGNFSRVFKVLNRIDGCMYAVKQSTRQLHLESERRKALMEVQALAALGYHENIVGYYTSWFENDKLYIQMELCDHSLSVQRTKLFTEGEILEILYQIAKALQCVHERGIAHLDVKPDNIYVKNGVYKLGDFGCATLVDSSLPIEEGDARYMPQEILNENFDHLDKVDIFSLGVAMYELIRGSSLPESGIHLLNLKEGKMPLLPGHSLQFQNLLKVMMDPDPTRRPSAKDLVHNHIFERRQRSTANKMH